MRCHIFFVLLNNMPDATPAKELTIGRRHVRRKKCCLSSAVGERKELPLAADNINLSALLCSSKQALFNRLCAFLALENFLALRQFFKQRGAKNCCCRVISQVEGFECAKIAARAFSISARTAFSCFPKLYIVG